MIRSLLFSIALLLSLQVSAQDRAADSLILVAVYDQLDGPNWRNPENWLTTEPLEMWEGVRVSNDRVIELSLINQDPVGPFPEMIVGLNALATFEVRSGSMTGSIPAGLTALTSLTRFSVSSNAMSGTVPNIWTQFPALKYLILQANDFSGPLPDIPDGLLLLYLNRNSFSGAIPEQWRDNSLSNVDIGNNDLTGSLDIFESWPNFSQADFSNNDWEAAAFPAWLDDKAALSFFACNDCNLTGDLPSDLDFSDNLSFRTCALRNNNLSGNPALLFPGAEAVGGFYLRLTNNNFEGEFPAHLLHDVSNIEVGGNDFSSITPFADSTGLGRLELLDNQLNFEDLVSVQTEILDSTISVRYSRMQPTLAPDTLDINEATTITIEAGDLDPSTTYEWEGPGVDGLTTSSITIDVDSNDDAGAYRCTMTNPDYPDLTLTRHPVVITTNFTTSTTDLLDATTINIYPNPSSDILVIETGSEETVRYTIFNSSGSTVDRGEVVGKATISINDLPSGTYPMSLQVGAKTYTRTVVKQ